MRHGWLLAGLVLLLTGCREPDGPLGGEAGGVLFVQSVPAGGRILLDGRATGRVTPDTLRGVGGLHQVVVELDTAQLRYGYSAQVVVPGTGEPSVLNGPLMARCGATTSECASAFRLEHLLGTVRFATNGAGPLFLQAGQGGGLYWPASSQNSYLSTATPVFAAQWNGQLTSSGIYDTNFFAGRPVPSTRIAGGQLTFSQSTWLLPPVALQQLTVVRGIEVREQLVTTTSLEGVFVVALTFRNISSDPIYGLVDPVSLQLGGITFEQAYIGLALDPDIGRASDDWVSYDPERTTVYAYDETLSEPDFTVDPTSPALVGLRVLRAPAGTGVVLNAWVTATSADWQAGNTSQVAGYGMLSGLGSYTPDHPGTVVGHLPPTSGDVRMVAAVGPLRLAPGDSARVTLAIALARPAPGTYNSGATVAPGNPDDAGRSLHAIAALLRERLGAAETLLGLVPVP